MSPREQLQTDIADWLGKQNWVSAPYGILCGMQSLGKGYARNVTFGVARTLDATITILSPNKIQLKGRGGLAAAWGIEWGRDFKSKEELINFFVDRTRGW